MKNDNLVFNQKSELTPYLATAIAEGFCEGENATQYDQMRAWAYIIRTGLVRNLQGWFNRIANDLINNDYITSDGDILWDNIPLELEY